MKKIVVNRRDLLRWATYSAPAVYLAGCGNGSLYGNEPNPSTAGNPTFSAVNGNDATMVCAKDCPTFAQLYSYSSGSQSPAITALGASLEGVAPTANRFNVADSAFAFDGGGSLASVGSVGPLLSGAFALSFWGNSQSTVHTQALAITDGDLAIAGIEFNNGSGIGVYWFDFQMYEISAGVVGQFTDGTWHHYLLQYDGTSLTIFVDGISQGNNSGPRALGDATALYVGGSSGVGWNGSIDSLRLYNRPFAAADVPALVYAWSQVKPVIRNDSLEAYYPFNGNAVNENGKGFNGTLHAVTPTTDRFGNAGSAYAFDGVQSYIELPVDMGPLTPPYAFGFWVQSSAQGTMTAYSINKGDANSADLDFTFNAGSALSVSIDGATPSSIVYGAPGALTDGVWHFIFLQCVSGTYDLYVDGVLRGSMQNSSAVVTSDSVTCFGRKAGTPANFWSGSIDDPTIWAMSSTTPFTGPEIVGLMQLQFLPHDGVGALVFQNKMWMMGGWNPNNELPTTNEVWSSTDGSNWDFVCAAPWQRRHDAGWLVYNNMLWIVGGDNNTGNYQNDVWSSVDGLNWVQVTDSVPWANRATQTVMVFNNLMWLMGGQTINLNPDIDTAGEAYNDVYSSADGVSWTLVTPHAGWSPRGQIIGQVVYGGKMWIIGGGTYDVRTYLNDVWNSSDGATWTQVTSAAPWAGRQFQNVTVFADKMWVIAGGTAASEGGSTDVWYSTDGSNWVNLPNTPWIQRHAASVWVFENALWFGCGSDVAVYNDIWKLSYAS
jgi:hypothetical protein